MKKEKMKFFLCALLFIVLAIITFRCTWPANHVFAASDLNIGRLAQMKGNMPESFIGGYTGNQLFGNAGFGLSFHRLMLYLMPLELFANAFFGMMLFLSSFSLVWFLRIWNRSWMAAVLGALVAFWFNSVMLAAGGHIAKMVVLALTALSLCFIEKAIRAVSHRHRIGWSILAGLMVGIMMIEQQDVALLSGLFIAPYAVFRLIQEHGPRLSSWVSVLIPIGMVALLLAGSTMMRSYQKFYTKASAVQNDPVEKWNFITQWSMVPAEWPDLIASGWGGWGTGRPDGPYWGKIGRSAEWESTGQGFRNFKITSKYIGIIPILFGAFAFAAALRDRKEKNNAVLLFWCIAGLIGLTLSFGKYTFLYKPFYHLPLVGNIRDQTKFLDLFQMCLGIVAAYGLDGLLGMGKGRRLAKVFWITGASCGLLMLLASMQIALFPEANKIKFTEMGFGNFADVIINNMSGAWLHAGLLLLAGAFLIFVVWKGYKWSKWIGLAFVLLLASDSLVLTSHYFRANDITALKNGNGLINYLKENQGYERTTFMDTSGIYNQWLASDGPYHDLNLFNIWQMPRMPADYKEYLGTVGRNQIRLWELASIKYVASPAGILQQLQQNPELNKLLKPVMNYQVPTAQGMRPDVLLEFNGTISRFALYQGWESIPLEKQCSLLASAQHNTRNVVLVDSASGLGKQMGLKHYQPLAVEEKGRSIKIPIQTDQQSIVRFSQYFQPYWSVFVDGKPADLLRIDYLCMGVAVEPGEHIVEFRCGGGGRNIAMAFGVFIASIGISFCLLFSSPRSREA